MKLYTEKQVNKVWKAGQKYWETSGASITLEELLEQEKSIEIPSDEEIITTVYNIIYEQDTTNKKSCLSLSEEIFDLIKQILTQNK